MAIKYNPANLGKVVYKSEAINLIPNEWGLFRQMGIFEHRYSSQKTIQIDRTVVTSNLVIDRNWDERNSNTSGPSKSYLTLNIPHLPVDDHVTPNDVDGNVAFATSIADNGITLETVDMVSARKAAKLRRDHALTLEYARAQAIVQGTAYAPNGTLATSYGPTYDYYTEFGVTRTSTPVPLNDGNEDPMTWINTAYTTVMDNLREGVQLDGVIGIAGPGFFEKLSRHPYVVNTLNNIITRQSESNNLGRLGADRFGLGARYRQLDLGGITWIEYRGSFNGQAYIPSEQAVLLPLASGADLYLTYFAPANRFDDVNKPARELYWWEYMNVKDDKLDIMTESNFLNVITDPASIVTLTITPEAP